MLRIPAATYRLQFNAGFTFEDARGIAGYLRELGVSDLYASPILKARKGSTHGYDVVDPTALNPELGSEEEFTKLHETLKDLGLGILLDIVPNHMAASDENAWWMSVLENGAHSEFMHYFDINWRQVMSKGQTEQKVLLPILGKPYGEAIESGEIRLAFDQGGFYFAYYDKRLPLAPTSYNQILRECVESLPTEGVAVELRDLVAGDGTMNSRFLKDTLARIYEQSTEFRDALDATIVRFNGEQGNAESFNALDALLDAQHYRLAYWRIASEKINYRRFFDVTDLVGVRIENPEVFEARNRRIFDLIAEGKVTGLRVDHIDGLFDPIGHMHKLQLRLATPDPMEGPKPESRVYIVVEKILENDEVLPPAFEVCGTTGYDFCDSVNALFVDPRGLETLSEFYREFTDIRRSFADLCYESKKKVISELFSGEMRALGKQIGDLSMQDRNARDFAPTELLAALTEITACMHVYRTYIREDCPVSDEDRTFVKRAVEEARRRSGPALDDRLFAFLERVLLVDPPSYVAADREKWLAFVMRWQQFTGRVMAKGVEDTSFYNYNRLVSLNEVGGNPDRGPNFDPLEEFHRRNERIQRHWPGTMNTTSTHDTKRSEDVRARINVLSELAGAWARDVRRWSKMNEPLRRGGVPDPNVELLVYQTILGMWPPESQRHTVEERLRQYLEKAAREAKTHTSWINPDPDYEKSLLDFAGGILANSGFMASMMRMQRRVAFHGFLNALSQLVLKIACPGIPDFYQGTEIWDFSLVDPDNRRPVDYEQRRSMLRKLKSAFESGSLDPGMLLRRHSDGRIKLFVTWRALELRTRRAELFRHGGYRAVRSASRNVCAFMRGQDVLAVVPRLTTQLVKTGISPVGGVWGEAMLPFEASGRFRDIFTEKTIDLDGSPVRVADLLSTLPVAILERDPTP